ncbi:hypothetical protein [Halorarum salinum]|uniref:Uncharacterized protein n=1 Tax=Halorarum salinum TaxID=2743089 RepID=A0A7D5QH81_9EURY|nr:hypothetical protein [Halobaculum salinum]QLG62044.1 hypothetical protein HUG12_10025 [Halobaculum salinum]
MTPTTLLLSHSAGDRPVIPLTEKQIIELAAGFILLAAAYYALIARRSTDPSERKQSRRLVLQAVAGFLMLAYAAEIIAPETGAWPVAIGHDLYHYFAALETVPHYADAQLTDFYDALLHQIGAATGPTHTQPGPLGQVEGVVRTIGLVVYTLFFSAASLGAQIPRRIAAGLSGLVNKAEEE